jgi:hypothetical protein
VWSVTTYLLDDEDLEDADDENDDDDESYNNTPCVHVLLLFH